MHLSEDLLRRYFQNRCNPEEEQFVGEALEREDPLATQLLETYWAEAAAGEDMPASERAAMLRQIRGRIASQKPSTVSGRLPVYILRVAASIAILTGIAIGMYTWFSRQVKYHTITSGEEQRQIIMPDSTMIWLASHSRLTYSSAYNKEDRQVRMTGEAYFEVKHDTRRPFIVHTSTLATRVLGTHFNVKADTAGQQQIEITLLEGKVSVSRVDSIAQHTEALAVLYPNQQLVYERETGKIHQREVRARDFADWKDGVLNLRNITFEEAVKRIERWYRVPISIENPAIKHCMIHASFQGESLENVLKSLGVSLTFTYTIQSRQVTIRGGLCKR